ncbi:MAG: hypothetical protein AAF495_16330 [Pseudomonadota bacterium]
MPLYPRLAAALLAAALAATPAAAAEEPADGLTQGGWRFNVAPYVWFISVEGDMTIKGLESEVDASFSDIWNNLNIGFFGRVEAQKGPVAIYGDVIYADLEMENSIGPLSVDADIDLLVFDFGVAYEAARVLLSDYGRDFPIWLTIEPMLGGRLYNVEGDLKPQRLAKVSESETWVDPVIGLRLMSDLTPNWNVRLRGDVGGFGVASDLTWQAMLGVGYSFGLFGERDATAIFGYRALYDDYQTGSGADKFAVDATFHGPLLGLSVAF